MNNARPAILLDRDGVLIEDVDLLIHKDAVRVLPGVHEFLRRAHGMGFALAVVSNQPVVARGLCSEENVREVHEHINRELEAACGVRIEKFYFCPHHPQATLEAYRADCDCRKPRPGMLLSAAADLSVDLSRSFMVGDRMSDIVAGNRAGCATILIESGRHLDAPIASAHHDSSVRADYVCADMLAAIDTIEVASRSKVP